MLVFGSEEKGLSSLVQKKCDLILSIDRGENTFDSLNVSVAAGVMIHHFVNRK